MTREALSFSLDFNVVDPAALLQAAAERLVEQMACLTVEDARAELKDDVRTAARILLDPGQLPGIEISDSSCD